MNEDRVFKFDQWLRSAKKGDHYTYYTGFLVKDRIKTLYFTGAGKVSFNNGEVNDLAVAVMKAYAAGYIEVTQEKVEDGLYKYIATKKSGVRIPR